MRRAAAYFENIASTVKAVYRIENLNFFFFTNTPKKVLKSGEVSGSNTAAHPLKPIFHLANLFARREAKTIIRQRDWLKLAGEKIRRKQVGSVPTFLSVRANKFAKWKTGLSALNLFRFCW